MADGWYAILYVAFKRWADGREILKSFPWVEGDSGCIVFPVAVSPTACAVVQSPNYHKLL